MVENKRKQEDGLNKNQLKQSYHYSFQDKEIISRHSKGEHHMLMINDQHRHLCI